MARNIKTLIVSLFILLGAGTASAAQCIFLWDANVETDLATYNLYSVLDTVTPTISVPSTDLTASVPYPQCKPGDQFYITATDIAGNESLPSLTVTVIDTITPLAPTGLVGSFQ